MTEHNPSRLHRRDFLWQGLTGVGIVGLSRAAGSAMPVDEAPSRPTRIGIIGVGPRGQSHLRMLLAHHPDVAITAICDIQVDRLKSAIETVRKARKESPVGYSKDEYDYRNLCERDDVDGILIATPVPWLNAMAVDGLRAGKHVGVEVSGPQTEDDCWELIAAKKKSGKRVMFLENCCYGQDNMMVYSMANQGVFGEPYYAEGSYVHDVRSLFFDSDGRITWRGIAQRDRYGSIYPQHGLGSTCKWLGINDGDRMEFCQTMMTSSRENHLRIVAQFGADSPQAQIKFKQGDFVSSLIHTAKGRMIRIDYGASCTRPYSRYYLLQGTKGCWDSRSGIYFARPGAKEEWEPIENYRHEYEHPYWRMAGAVARRTSGHGGIDYYCINDFVKMVREDKEPWVDVYDAASWSSLIFCSKLSLDRNGARVPMPDFTEGKWKDSKWRRDRMAIS